MPSQIKTRSVTFVSYVKNQELTMERGEYTFSGGRQIGETPGRHIRFANGMYVTDKQDEIDFLRERISAPDGAEIFEVSASAPEPSDVLLELVTADRDRTRELLEQERANWDRPMVIQACEAKLAQFPRVGRPPKTD